MPRGGKRKGAGRPRTGNTTEAASFRAPKVEMTIYRRAARRAGIALSAWVRETLRARRVELDE